MQVHSKTAEDSFLVTGEEGRRYEVCVNLPVTYSSRPDARYPVLYLLDAPLIFGSACDAIRVACLPRIMFPDLPIHPSNIPELIVVGMGYPGDDPLAVAKETVLRRIYDYTARTVPGAALQQHCLAVSPDYKFGGAAAFLSMLTGKVREVVEQRYRTDPRERVLFGGSAGGHFATYALLHKPDAFTRYIIASPAVELCGDDIYAQEQDYAATHDDLPVSVFLSFGGGELESFPSIAVASGTSRLAENLRGRGYPNLRLHSSILHGETHERAVPVAIARGLETLFADRAVGAP